MNLADQSKNITLVGNPTWNANSLEFTGNTNTYATLPASLSFDMPNITVEFVISYPITNDYRVILQEKSGRVVIGLYHSNRAIVTGSINGSIQTSFIVLPERSQGGKPNTHTVRYTDDNFNYNYLFNAGLVTARAGQNYWFADILSYSLIGRRITSYNSNQCHFIGKIQSIRIYNRILSDAEILYNHNVDKARFGIE
jgi:hypothetical protein